MKIKENGRLDKRESALLAGYLSYGGNLSSCTWGSLISDASQAIGVVVSKANIMRVAREYSVTLPKHLIDAAVDQGVNDRRVQLSRIENKIDKIMDCWGIK